MSQAVEWAYLHTSINRVCLLSPGAPSYNMYSGFPARGEDFVKWVKFYGQKKNNSQTSPEI